MNNTDSVAASSQSPHQMTVIGIDLGTTYSSVAYITASKTTPFKDIKSSCIEVEQPTTEGTYTSPLVASVVALQPGKSDFIGEGAKRILERSGSAALVPERSIFFNTKNEMGIRKTYRSAPEPYKHPYKIAGHILDFLRNAASRELPVTPNRIVVTVPASFQISQRRDTIEAAKLAKIALSENDLLDEPTAALIAYLHEHDGAQVLRPKVRNTVLVFDFGGGTCDVSVISVRPQENGQMEVATITSSRYHRLGGSDIDIAIVQKLLLPKLLEANRIPMDRRSWKLKKKLLEPQLLGTAEALKLSICAQINKLKSFNKYSEETAKSIRCRQPDVQVSINERTQWVLNEPSITAAEWDEIIAPFIDPNVLHVKESEYTMELSIFAPLEDALSRGNVTSMEIDVVLLAGGSSQIPNVKDAIAEYFSTAEVLTFGNSLDVQTAVARGAALHAAFLEQTGLPLVRPVSLDGIGILTNNTKPFELVAQNTPLPFPPDGSMVTLRDFRIPAGTSQVLRMDFVSLPNNQRLQSATWYLGSKVMPDELITIQYRFTASQVFEFVAFTDRQPDIRYEATLDNPLVAVSNTNEIMLNIQELEEELRTQSFAEKVEAEKLVQLATWYAELNQVEKALDYLQDAGRKYGAPNVSVLNLMGMYHGRLGNDAMEERFYREADSCSESWGGALFNLALALRRRNQLNQAVEVIEQSIAKEPDDGPAHTLHALCLKSLNRLPEAEDALNQAGQYFGPIGSQSQFELGWYKIYANEIVDAQLREKVDREMRMRAELRSSLDELPDAPRPVAPTDADAGQSG